MIGRISRLSLIKVLLTAVLTLTIVSIVVHTRMLFDRPALIQSMTSGPVLYTGQKLNGTGIVRYVLQRENNRQAYQRDVLSYRRDVVSQNQTFFIDPNTSYVDYCNGCFKHDFNYIIQNDGICSGRPPSSMLISLLLLITSSHSHYKERMAIRKSWLTISANNTSNVRFAFLLGKSINTTNEEIERENEIFHDIVQEDFYDTYYNLTYKTMMGFKWAVEKCPLAKCVMKTDDDVFLNVPNILQVCKSVWMSNDKVLVGRCGHKSEPVRDTSSKWYLSTEQYPARYFPDFCLGPGYFSSLDVIAAVYRISQDIPFFPFEDVYVGLCLKKLHIRIRSMRGFGILFEKYKSRVCSIKDANVYSVHKVSHTDLKDIWTRPCDAHTRLYGLLRNNNQLLLNRQQVLKSQNQVALPFRPTKDERLRPMHFDLYQKQNNVQPKKALVGKSLQVLN